MIEKIIKEEKITFEPRTSNGRVHGMMIALLYEEDSIFHGKGYILYVNYIIKDAVSSSVSKYLSTNKQDAIKKFNNFKVQMQQLKTEKWMKMAYLDRYMKQLLK